MVSPKGTATPPRVAGEVRLSTWGHDWRASEREAMTFPVDNLAAFGL